MKNLFPLFIFLIITGLQAQKIDVSKGATKKNKKMTGVEGTFTIGGKPFLIVAESNRLIVDYSAVFYPVEEDMSLGEVIRQENINIIDGEMELEKCLYIEHIIVNGGKTYLFYTKRNGRKGKVFFVELEEDCQIDPDKATEVMQLDLGLISKNTNFTVRQSPDGSRIFLAGMVKKTQKSSDFFFKVYSAGMKSLIWEKTFSAPAADQAYFGGTGRFNTGKDQNSIIDNYFLVNNEGRVYFLVNRTNPSETKSDLGMISVDPKGEKQTEADIKEPGNWLGSNFFRLNQNGRANFFFFYSAHDDKVVFQVGDISPVNTNSLRVLEYDGNALETIYDHEFTNEEQSLFYPVKLRKAKGNYKISEFSFTNIVYTATGDMAIILEKSLSTVGHERPASNTKHGYICVLVMDSEFKIKFTHSFMRASNSRNYGGGYSVGATYLMNGNLYAFFISDQDQLQCVQFTNLETYKVSSLAAKFPDSEGFPVFSESMVYQGGILVPVRDEKLVGAAWIKQ